MLDLDVIAEPTAAISALEPMRARLLAELAEPASSAMLASRLGLPRQKLNYHLKELESHGLVTTAETRRWGGLVERMLVASAGSYVVSPAALGPAAADPAKATRRLSARYAIALAARAVRELGELVRGADAAGKELATLSIDSEIRFASPADRAAFTDELTREVTRLAARYHQPASAGGRSHRLIVIAHPTQ